MLNTVRFLIISLLFFSSTVHSDLIYDPSTNSYIDDSVENVVVVEIQTETETSSTDEANDDGLVYDPWTGEYVAPEDLTERPSGVSTTSLADETTEEEPAEEEQVEEPEELADEEAPLMEVDPALVETGSDAIATETSATPTETEEEDLPVPVVVIEEIDLIEPVTIVEVTDLVETASDQIKDAATLRTDLEDQKTMLLEYLNSKKWEVEKNYVSSVQDIFGVYFDEMSSCLQDTQTLDTLSKDMGVLYKDLESRMQTSSATHFAEIAYLEYAGNNWLYSESKKEIEWWVLSNSIDTYGQNGLLLIDHYFSEANESIDTFVASNEAKNYEESIVVYEKRKEIIGKLVQVFSHFEESTFFNQTVIGPRADELREMTDDIFRIFDEQIRVRRWWADNIQTMIQQVQRDYLVYVDQVLAELFPADWIQDIYKNYTLLDGIYGLHAQQTNCSSILQNDTIETSGPQLIEKIQKLQEGIAISNSAVWWATTWTALQDGFSQMLIDYYETSVVPYIATQLWEELPKEELVQESTSTTTSTVAQESSSSTRAVVSSNITQVDTSKMTPVQLRQHEKQLALYLQQQETYNKQLYQAYEKMIVTYLTDLKAEYKEKRTIQAFEKLMEKAYGKVEVMLAWGTVWWETLIILEAIRAAIEKVLVG